MFFGTRGKTSFPLLGLSASLALICFFIRRRFPKECVEELFSEHTRAKQLKDNFNWKQTTIVQSYK
jgi:hypothetical protein